MILARIQCGQHRGEFRAAATKFLMNNVTWCRQIASLSWQHAVVFLTCLVPCRLLMLMNFPAGSCSDRPRRMLSLWLSIFRSSIALPAFRSQQEAVSGLSPFPQLPKYCSQFQLFSHSDNVLRSPTYSTCFSCPPSRWQHNPQRKQQPNWAMNRASPSLSRFVSTAHKLPWIKQYEAECQRKSHSLLFSFSVDLSIFSYRPFLGISLGPKLCLHSEGSRYLGVVTVAL